MKKIALLAINNFPFWGKTFSHLEQLCDEIYVRFDSATGDPMILRTLHNIYSDKNSKLKGVSVISGYGTPKFREDLLRMLDNVNLSEDDLIFTLDQDEVFDDSIKDELVLFQISDKRCMSFGYHPLASDHGSINNDIPYPSKPHIKCFKYSKGLSYYPYHGEGMIGTYRHSVYKAKTLINHYCCYTKGLEDMKHWTETIPSRKIKGHKSCSIIGFGPSIEKGINPIGEIFTMNDYYNAFPKDLTRQVTRAYEMHDLDKRLKTLTKDGQSHIARLDEMGKMGTRIIMQDKTNLVTNSEAYPLDAFRKHEYPIYFGGTPVYALAHAILDGYDRIYIMGLDQMDWQHVLQRQSFIFWVGIGMGRGVEFSGELTFLNVFAGEDKKYGYSGWGPDWTPRMNKLLYAGFPFEIVMKEDKSYAMTGDMRK